MVNKLLICISLIFSLSRLVAETNNFYTHAEIAKHSLSNDCWMIIDKKVYDVSSYSTEHKSKQDYDYSKFCGKDATSAWLDKDGKNEPHKRKSNLLLKKFLIGILE